jgi:hypothetical protein
MEPGRLARDEFVMCGGLSLLRKSGRKKEHPPERSDGCWLKSLGCVLGEGLAAWRLASHVLWDEDQGFRLNLSSGVSSA